jgi:cytochrome c556
MSRLAMSRLAWAALALALTACGGQTAEEPAAEAARPAEYKLQLPMKELMAHVIDPAADGIWLRQGWTVTDAGEVDLFPKTDEEWLAAENSAYTLAETANLLLLPGRPQDEDPAWQEFSHRLYDASLKAQAAAEAKDPDAFFDAGGEIFVVCRDCHEKYIIGGP